MVKFRCSIDFEYDFAFRPNPGKKEKSISSSKNIILQFKNMYDGKLLKIDAVTF